MMMYDNKVFLKRNLTKKIAKRRNVELRNELVFLTIDGEVIIKAGRTGGIREIILKRQGGVESE